MDIPCLARSRRIRPISTLGASEMRVVRQRPPSTLPRLSTTISLMINGLNTKRTMYPLKRRRDGVTYEQRNEKQARTSTPTAHRRSTPQRKGAREEEAVVVEMPTRGYNRSGLFI